MAIDYGEDFAGIDDVDYGLTTISGPALVAQDVARELGTPFGSVWYAREYGNDLRRYLNAVSPNVGSVAASAESTALRDERVQRAFARVTFMAEVLTVQLRIYLASGPFDMTVTVDKLSVQLLSVT